MLVNKCDLFCDNLVLTTTPYVLNSPVSLSIFREFISALEGATVKITNNNFSGLWQLCEEFHFQEFSARLSQFRDFKEAATVEDSETRMRLSALEQRMQQHDVQISVLQAELLRQSRAQESTDTGIAGSTDEVSVLRSVVETVTAPALSQLQSELERLKGSTATLLGRVGRLEAELSALRTVAVPGQASPEPTFG
jgi:hypothetical protein